MGTAAHPGKLSHVVYVSSAMLIGVCLSACTMDLPEDRLQDYETRLFRTLDIAVTRHGTRGFTRFPARRQLQLNRTRESIDILDLWSIRECALHVVVAQKNSSLGRVARPSTRMFYELDFLRLTPACIEYLIQAGKDDLAATLGDVQARKQMSLPAIIWQGVLGGEEYQRYWKVPQQLDDYPAAVSYSADRAVAALASDVQRWLGGDYEFDSALVEANLKTLRTGDGGALFKSAALQAEYLGRIDTALQQRLKEAPVCRSAGDEKAAILDNVVRKYFVGVIQPWSVQLQSRAYKLDAVRDLEALLAAGEPAAFGAWRERRDHLIVEALRAPREHVETLLPIMRQCGLVPDT